MCRREDRRKSIHWSRCGKNSFYRQGSSRRSKPLHKRNPVLIAAFVGAIIGALAIRFVRHPQPNQDWLVVASILGWMLFALYWSLSATNAPAKDAESRASRRVHEVLINAGYLVLLAPIGFSPAIPLLQYRFVPVSLIPKILGLAVQAGSFALAVWARRTLGQNWSGRIEIKTDHQLVRSGPYRVLRHPIYSAVFGMLTGTALTIGKVHALLAIAIVGVAYWRKIRMEEVKLREAFGAGYEDYRRSTWALIPGFF